MTFEFKIPEEWLYRGKRRFKDWKKNVWWNDKQTEHNRQFSQYCEQHNIVNREDAITCEVFRTALFLIYKGKKRCTAYSPTSGSAKHTMESLLGIYFTREKFDDYMKKYCPDIQRTPMSQSDYAIKNNMYTGYKYKLSTIL